MAQSRPQPFGGPPSLPHPRGPPRYRDQGLTHTRRRTPRRGEKPTRTHHQIPRRIDKRPERHRRADLAQPGVVFQGIRPAEMFRCIEVALGAPTQVSNCIVVFSGCTVGFRRSRRIVHETGSVLVGDCLLARARRGRVATHRHNRHMAPTPLCLCHDWLETSREERFLHMI